MYKSVNIHWITIGYPLKNQVVTEITKNQYLGAY